MKKLFLILIFVFLPLTSFALDPIVPCNGPDCDFNSLITLGNRVIKFLILIGGSLASMAFAYAGWLYITSGGDTGKISKAKEIFWKVGIGFVMMLAGWLIISLILTMLGYTPPAGLDFISGLIRR